MSSSPSPETMPQTSLAPEFSSQFSTASGASALSDTRRRGPLFAAAFGLALVGGIFYFVLSAMTDDAKEETPVAEVQSTAPAAAAAVGAATPPAPAAPVVAVVAPSAAPTVYFAYKTANLSADTRAALDVWVAQMQHDKKLTVTLGGHADERGTKRYNYRLGARRALAAKAYLVSKGIDAGRLTAVSFGKTQPLVTGHGESSWSHNRRVELRSVIAMSQR